MTDKKNKWCSQLRQDYLYDEYEKSFKTQSEFEEDASFSDRFSDIDFGRLRPFALAGLTLIFLALLVAVAVRSDLTAALSAPSTPLPTSASTQVASAAPTEAGTPSSAATENIPGETALSDCVEWDDVSAADAGSELCM